MLFLLLSPCPPRKLNSAHCLGASSNVTFSGKAFPVLPVKKIITLPVGALSPGLTVRSPVELSQSHAHGALIYKMEANHLYLRGRVLEEFNKRGQVKPLNTVWAQSMPSNPWLKLQFQPANPAESRKGMSGTLPIYLFQLFSGGPRVLFLVGYYQPTAHWKINND